MHKRPDKLVLALAVLCAGTAAIASLREPKTLGDSATPALIDNQTFVINADLSDSEQTDLKKIPREAYSEMLRRPLFSATRRPVVPTVTPPPIPIAAEAPTPSNHRLVGVVMIDDEQFALINDPPAHKSQRVAVGEAISGWTVSELTSGSATITQGGQSKTLVLERKSGSHHRQKLKAANTRRLATRAAVTARRTNAQDADGAGASDVQIPPLNPVGVENENSDNVDSDDPTRNGP